MHYRLRVVGCDLPGVSPDIVGAYAFRMPGNPLWRIDFLGGGPMYDSRALAERSREAAERDLRMAFALEEVA